MVVDGTGGDGMTVDEAGRGRGVVWDGHVFLSVASFGGKMLLGYMPQLYGANGL